MKGEESVYLVSRLKLQFKYTVVQYSWKDKHINQWKRVKSPEIDPHNNAQMIFFLLSNEGKTAFQQMALEQLDIHRQKNEP